MRKPTRFLAGAAALLMMAVGFPAGAQTDVPVSVLTTAGTRSISIQDMAGGALTSLDFGQERSLPFRVKVVDDAMSLNSFTVDASMTNLYLDNAGMQWATKIDSANVKLESQLNPLNVLDVTATVQPIVSTVSSLTGTLCDVILVRVPATGEACTLNASDIVGKVQEVDVPVDLANLALPLVPQSNAEGFFTAPDYTSGVGAQVPGNPGTAGTALRLVGGTKIDLLSPAVSGTVLNGMLEALRTDIPVTPLADLVDTDKVLEALTAIYPVVGTLGLADTATLLAATTGSVPSLSLTDVLTQTGTYYSLPRLTVNPGSAPAGTYRGTLVVTGLQ